MSRIKYIIIILFPLICHESYGQSAADSTRITLGYPIYSQYLHNGLMINPAYAGAREALSAALSYRMQWMGIENAPKLQTISIHTPMKNDKVALGIKAQFMQYGATSSQSIYAIYAYHIKLGKGKMSLGLGAGIDMSNTNYNKLVGITRPDPVFPESSNKYIFPNVSAGAYYFNNRIFAGLSVPSFLFYRNTGNGKTEPFFSFNEFDFIVTAGGLITIIPVLKFKPSVLLDYSMHDTKSINQLDINGNLIISDFVWVGGSYRMSEQVIVGLLQVQVTHQLMLGVSYDYPAGRMNSYSKGSSEFFLRYEFGSKVSAANPRYF